MPQRRAPYWHRAGCPLRVAHSFPIVTAHKLLQGPSSRDDTTINCLSWALCHGAGRSRNLDNGVGFKGNDTGSMELYSHIYHSSEHICCSLASLLTRDYRLGIRRHMQYCSHAQCWQVSSNRLRQGYPAAVQGYHETCPSTSACKNANSKKSTLPFHEGGDLVPSFEVDIRRI